MVVVIFRPELGQVMVDVTDRQFRLDAPDTHRFEQQKCRRTRRILCQGLVDPNPDGGSGLQFAFHQVFSKYFIG